MAQVDDLARVAAGGAMNGDQPREGEEVQLLGRGAGFLQPELDHQARVAQAERFEVVVEVDAVAEVGVAADDPLELLLREDHDLQQLVVVGLVVQELAQQLEAEHRDFLPFVDDQDGRPLLVDALAEQGVLDELLGLPVGGALRQLSAAEQLGGRGQEIRRVLEQGVQDQVGLHVLAVGEAADDLAAERGLAGADVADDDVQAAAQVQRELKLLKAVEVLAGSGKSNRGRASWRTAPGSD